MCRFVSGSGARGVQQRQAQWGLCPAGAGAAPSTPPPFRAAWSWREAGREEWALCCPQLNEQSLFCKYVLLPTASPTLGCGWHCHVWSWKELLPSSGITFLPSLAGSSVGWGGVGSGVTRTKSSVGAGEGDGVSALQVSMSPPGAQTESFLWGKSAGSAGPPAPAKPRASGSHSTPASIPGQAGSLPGSFLLCCCRSVTVSG